MIPTSLLVFTVDINCNTNLRYEEDYRCAFRVQIFLPWTLYSHFMSAVMKKEPQNLDKNDTKGLKLEYAHRNFENSRYEWPGVACQGCSLISHKPVGDLGEEFPTPPLILQKLRPEGLKVFFSL